jgi:fructose/tagatose bisphosphate aldolase
MAVEFKATRGSPSSRLDFVFLRSEAFNRISRDRTYLRRTELSMPVADPAKYFGMLDRARKGKFAYLAINVTSLTTANAVLMGLAASRSDGIMQYAFTRAIAGHFFKNYEGVLKLDGEVGHKKAYDPRSYLALAETAMAERIKQAVTELRAVGTTVVK